MTGSASAHTNRLAGATSPYLLQHAHNPVDWWQWGREALDEAKRSNRPILLSVGYAACHWCHVMAHESFEDDATAAVMNALFVNIKVDREERPDIDQIYMNALHLLGEQGGWPMTMFLTPAGEPVWGGTYFPKESRYGRPAFVDVLHEVARLFRDEPTRIEQNRTALLAQLAEKARPEGKIVIGARELDAAAKQIGNAFDAVVGTVAPAEPDAVGDGRPRAAAVPAVGAADVGAGVHDVVAGRMVDEAGDVAAAAPFHARVARGRADGGRDGGGLRRGRRAGGTVAAAAACDERRNRGRDDE